MLATLLLNDTVFGREVAAAVPFLSPVAIAVRIALRAGLTVVALADAEALREAVGKDEEMLKAAIWMAEAAERS